MNFDKIIYKKDSKGKVRYLRVYVNNDILNQESGILETTSPVLHSKTCKGKNIGKSNETSPNAQAIKEAESLIDRKLSEGYFDTISEAKSEEVILPMLANDYKKHSHKIDWTKDKVFVQPKLDGMRCLKNRNILISRKNKEIDTMFHIADEMPNVPHILDGELYAHGEDFQTNMELIKKYRPGESEAVKYHVYDLIVSDMPNTPFTVRYLALKSILDTFKPEHIELVETHQIFSEKELQEYHQQFLSEGYEGTMVRISKNGYDINKRSDQLLKYKDFKDIAIPVKDILPCKNKTEWGEPIFDWPGALGHRAGKDILGSNTKLSHKLRKEILANKQDYVGKIAEVRFFEYSNTGVPRFPVVVGFREDK